MAIDHRRDVPQDGAPETRGNDDLGAAAVDLDEVRRCVVTLTTALAGRAAQHAH